MSESPKDSMFPRCFKITGFPETQLVPIFSMDAAVVKYSFPSAQCSEDTGWIMQTKPVVNWKITLDFIKIYINNLIFLNFISFGKSRGKQVRSSSTGVRNADRRKSVKLVQPTPATSHLRKASSAVSSAIQCGAWNICCLGSIAALKFYCTNSIIGSKCYMLTYSVYSQWK